MMSQQDIFQALTESHDRQRKLCDKIESLMDSDLDAAKKVYPGLEIELQAHAAAEERHLYAPVMEYDDGLDLSRHAIAEHHEMDEMMHKLNDGRISDDTWKETCHALIHELRHHLKEEEKKFFIQAKKLLDEEQQERLGALYEVEHNHFERNNNE